MPLAFLNVALRAALLVLGFTWAVTAVFKDDLPRAGDILPEIKTQPVQVATTTRQFNVERGGVTYAVIPKYDYRLYGLVVSTHDSRSWLDYAHESWDDYLNVMDMCVIWGSNTNDERYDAFTFASGQWTCSFKTEDGAAWSSWNQFQLSNNHLLSSGEEITDLLEDVEVGDQVFMRGYLAEYAHAGGFRRGTSTTRLDTGNGACETVYVTEFRILRKSNTLLRAFNDVGRWGFILSALGLIALFVKTTFFPTAPDPYALLAQGQALAMRGKYDKALAPLTQALDLDPDLAEAYEDRAVVLDALGQPDLAAKDRAAAKRLRGDAEPGDGGGDGPPPLDF